VPPSGSQRSVRNDRRRPVPNERTAKRTKGVATVRSRFQTTAELAAVGLAAAAVWAGCWWAPTELTMGPAQRILYVHVAVAWFALAGFLASAATAGLFLFSRRLSWDDWTQATTEVGWLCCLLTLATGSLWAHEAWGVWWTWEPRLTSVFILWLLYSGGLVVRLGLQDRHQRARFASVLAILGAVDVPLVVLATRWFRGIHPTAPQMEPSMRAALVLSVVGINAFLTLLVLRRRRQLQLERDVQELEFVLEELAWDERPVTEQPAGGASG